MNSRVDISNDFLKVLIVDDDDVDRERIRRMLFSTEEHWMVSEAEDTSSALNILNDDHHDCVIVDYRLGYYSGIELLKDIRSTIDKTCAVIMVTGLGDEGVAAEAMRAGACDYLTKNQLQPAHLLRAVHSAVHRADLEKKLHDMAHYDSLTGLANRPMLTDRLQQVISRQSRDDSCSALAFIDLDNFKPVNDRYGHEAGDFVLVEISDRLKKSLRGADTVARIGGDEFVLLLGNLKSTVECEILLSRVLSSIVAPIELPDGHRVQVSASIGVTMVMDSSTDADTVLRRADQTMYKVKSAGRNNILFFDPEEEKRHEQRRALFKNVEAGLARGEFCLFYQPKIQLRGRETAGLEALIRWNHPEFGLLAPFKFADALVHPVLSVVIGEWVLKEAMRQLGFWKTLGINVKVSVNISAKHLQKPTFVSRLKEILDSVPAVCPSCLELEVLETVAVDDMAETVDVLRRCREIGVSVALDDFGTGYSSLTYLKRLPLDTLKIDREFVQNMLVSKEDKAIVESVIALSQAFGYRLVAEGVETKDHETMLVSLGCDLGQGYSIARPLPAEEVLGWMKHNQSLQTDSYNNQMLA